MKFQDDDKIKIKSSSNSQYILLNHNVNKKFFIFSKLSFSVIIFLIILFYIIAINIRNKNMHIKKPLSRKL